MNIDVAEIEILDSYEITNSVLSIAKKISKNAEAMVLSKINTDKDIGDDDDDEEFPEGKELTKLHKHKERNPKVVRKKKKKVFREHGKLECEVCGFDFVKIYGHLGYGFAECHHTVPVSKLTEGDKTKLSDLAIVCANCHRMLHKARPIISIGELQAVVITNADK